MKYFFLAIKVIVVLLFMGNLFVWAAAHGSGHRIPASIDTSILVFGVFLVAIFIAISFLSKRKRKLE